MWKTGKRKGGKKKERKRLTANLDATVLSILLGLLVELVANIDVCRAYVVEVESEFISTRRN